MFLFTAGKIIINMNIYYFLVCEAKHGTSAVVCTWGAIFIYPHPSIKTYLTDWQLFWVGTGLLETNEGNNHNSI